MEATGSVPASGEASHPAVTIGLEDPRIAAFLEGRQYSISHVDLVASPEGGEGARVVVSLAEPVPLEQWVEEYVCAIFRESNDITGVVWIADFDQGRVIALSPEWDHSISCV